MEIHLEGITPISAVKTRKNVYLPHGDKAEAYAYCFYRGDDVLKSGGASFNGRMRRVFSATLETEHFIPNIRFLIQAYKWDHRTQKPVVVARASGPAYLLTTKKVILLRSQSPRIPPAG